MRDYVKDDHHENFPNQKMTANHQEFKSGD